MGRELKSDIDATYYQPCLRSICQEIDDVIEAIVKQFDTKTMKEASFKRINHLFGNLKAISDVKLSRMIAKDLSDSEHETKFRLENNMNGLKQLIISKLVQLGDAAYTSNQDKDLSKLKSYLINLQTAKHNLMNDESQQEIGKAIEKCLKEHKRHYGILALGKILTNKNNIDEELYWGKEIVNEYPIFSGASIQLFNEKVSANTKSVDVVLKNMKVSDDSDGAYDETKIAQFRADYLEKRFNAFDKQYHNLIDKYVSNWDTTKVLMII